MNKPYKATERNGYWVLIDTRTEELAELHAIIQAVAYERSK